MKENAVKRMIKEGKIPIGTFVMEFNTPGLPAIIEQTGAEFIIYDMEHGGFGTDTIRTMLSYNRGLHVLPFVRVPDTCYDFIARSLDAGAKGLLIPMVENKEQALKILECSKYPPIGKRGTTTNIAHDDFIGGNLEEILRSANEQILIMAQIETETGVNNVEEIISLQGIDVAWVGHNDLSVSMGLPGQVNHPRVVEAMEHVAQVSAKYGKVAGRLAPDLKTALEWIDRGYRMIAYGNDIRLLQNSLRQGINDIRKHAGQA